MTSGHNFSKGKEDQAEFLPGKGIKYQIEVQYRSQRELCIRKAMINLFGTVSR